jgi:hypothetical protein
MSRYLLTQSLLGSWLYIYNAFEGYEDNAFDDFLLTLRREPKEQTEAMLAGIDFENLVNAAADGAEAKTSAVREIADIVRGGQKQVALYQDKTIGGVDYLLYGRLDYLKAGVIYDIKYSKSYEAGKFTDSIQHPFYFELCPEAPEFKYLISDGNDVFKETYFRNLTPEIDKTVIQFMQFLNERKLAEIYFEKWKAQGGE